ncbi:MAG TPA: glycosyltransferase family A protein [Trichocoleus sp.]|jgi:glycosyltransferase involved in cell wall biosynthesis
MVLFSIIIPVFNRAKLIGSTLDSILNQEFKNLEIIVVDDGSTDETLKILEKYQDRIQILHQPNRGPGAARNLGIQNARGRYIAFLDSDDLWFPWTLATYNQVILEHDFPAFIAGQAVQFQDEAEIRLVQPSLSLIEFFSDYYSSSKKPVWVLPGAAAIRADVLKQVGGFTKEWINGEDSDLWLKLGTAPGFISIQSPPVLAYRQHTNTAVSNNTRTYQGICYMIDQEKSGRYPGAEVRRLERLEILTRHIRPVSFACIKQGDIKAALGLYQETLEWHFDLKRIRYLLGFLVILIANLLFKNLGSKVVVE